MKPLNLKQWEVKAILEGNKTQLVKPVKHTRTLCIGHEAVICVGEENEKNVCVVGVHESDLQTTPPRLEYTAPLVAPFIGKKVGHTITLPIKGNDTVVQLIAIKHTTS